MPDDKSDSWFRYSESVEAFYTDKKVQAAVKLLVNNGFVFAPERDEWGEGEAYYDACLAAAQTKIEFAKDLYRLWSAVWRNIPTDWVAVPADAKDEELSLDPELRWEGDHFTRHFRFRGHIVELWVELDYDDRQLDGTFIGLDLLKGSRSQLKRGAIWSDRPATWKFENAALRLFLPKSYKQGFDLTPLRKGAEEAINFIARFEG